MGKNRESELERLMGDVTGRHSKRMNAILSTMEDEDFVVAYFKALEYSAPKLQRKEIIESAKETKIIIEHVTVNATQIVESEKKKEPKEDMPRFTREIIG
jgi:hypothetical protein